MTPSEAARKTALLVSETERGTLSVTGKDRGEWLNGLLTCDVTKVTPELGALGLFLTKTGKILTDVYVVASADALYLGVDKKKLEEIHTALDKMLVMEDADITVRPDLSWFSLHGPRAVELGPTLAGVAWGNIDFLGLGGVAIVASERPSSSELVRGSEADWLALRVERGFPAFGVDYGSEDNPHEASLDQRAVSWTKGCYLGQEVVYMQGKRGRVKRRVVLLELASGAPPPSGTAVLDAEGKPAGTVTSAAHSDALGVSVALARVNGEPALPLSVDGAAARIVERPGAA
jgi:folate-binding protein YgfZ